MRAVIACLVLLVCAAATPAHAQTPLPEDAQTLHACLSAQTETSTLRTCLGEVSHPCLDQGLNSTAEMRECASMEADAWSALVSYYAETLRAQQPSNRALLDRYLAESETWTAARCEYRASETGGGTMTGVTRDFCLGDSRAEIAIDLYLRLKL